MSSPYRPDRVPQDEVWRLPPLPDTLLGDDRVPEHTNTISFDKPNPYSVSQLGQHTFPVSSAVSPQNTTNAETDQHSRYSAAHTDQLPDSYQGYDTPRSARGMTVRKWMARTAWLAAFVAVPDMAFAVADFNHTPGSFINVEDPMHAFSTPIKVWKDVGNSPIVHGIEKLIHFAGSVI